jgi:parvulin-like peptidyl-prolyl isomerase
MEAITVRLAAGEDFAAVVAQNSEDDATKLRGGELGYLSAKRMPPDFVEAAAKLRPGEISKPVRTRLGFHILKLIDIQAPRQQTFDEVRGDVAIEVANDKRRIALQKLSAGLAATASYLRPL